MSFVSFCKTQAWNMGLGFTCVGVIISFVDPVLGMAVAAVSSISGYMVYDIFKNREVAQQYPMELQKTIRDASIKVRSLDGEGYRYVAAQVKETLSSKIKEQIDSQKARRLPGNNFLRLNAGLNILGMTLVGIGATCLIKANKISGQSSSSEVNDKTYGYIGSGCWMSGLIVTFFAHHFTAPKLRTLHTTLEKTRTEVDRIYNDFLLEPLPSTSGASCSVIATKDFSTMPGVIV